MTVEAQVQAGIGVTGHDVGFDAVVGAVGEHIEPVHVALQHIASYGIIITGWEEVYAVGSIAVGHVISNEVIIGVGKVYSIPALATQAVQAGIVSHNGVVIGEEQGNSRLGAMNDGVVGYAGSL